MAVYVLNTGIDQSLQHTLTIFHSSTLAALLATRPLARQVDSLSSASQIPEGRPSLDRARRF